MNKLGMFWIVGCFIFLFSCQSEEKNIGNFNLLPKPQEMLLTGNSDLTVETIQFCHGVEGKELPVLGNLLSAIKAVRFATLKEKKSDQNIFFIPDLYQVNFLRICITNVVSGISINNMLCMGTQWAVFSEKNLSLR